MVPKQMLGETLLPLNDLKLKKEELYNEYTKKYNHPPERRKLLGREIPKLGCLWNDVVHFLPVHPFHVYNSLKTAGLDISNDLKFFKIPIENLRHNKNVIYLYTKEKYRGPGAGMNSEDVQLLDIGDYEELSELPSDTMNYYDEQHRKGNRFGMFHFVPHILSLGKVEISNAEVISWGKAGD